jgi:hypothetical protein
LEAEPDALSAACYTSYTMVSVAADVEDAKAFARSPLAPLLEAVRAVEQAVTEDDEAAIVQASECVRFEAEHLCFALMAWSGRAP